MEIVLVTEEGAGVGGSFATEEGCKDVPDGAAVSSFKIGAPSLIWVSCLSAPIDCNIG